MNKKIRVGILFGGKSAEHEVSLQSAKNIIEAIDKEKYEVVPIGIDKQGRWQFFSDSDFLLNAEDSKLIKLNKANKEVTIVSDSKNVQLISLVDGKAVTALDVVFPVLHGTYGEDGTMQGLLKLAGIPFVGSSVLGSAICMDKDVAKRLMNNSGLPNAKFITVRKPELDSINFTKIKNELGLPVFVKPVNQGSSVGVHKVKDKDDFWQAIKDAFEYDSKIIIEEYIKGREIECAVLGNNNLQASVPGEVITQYEFYSYEAKYIDTAGADLEIPAKLSDDKIKEIQNLAMQAFKILECEGMTRVDFFLKTNGEIFINEVNTIPGFTKISMYPKLWEYSGLTYRNLIDKLIQLAIERFVEEKKLKINFN